MAHDEYPSYQAMESKTSGVSRLAREIDFLTYLAFALFQERLLSPMIDEVNLPSQEPVQSLGFLLGYSLPIDSCLYGVFSC